MFTEIANLYWTCFSRTRSSNNDLAGWQSIVSNDEIKGNFGSNTINCLGSCRHDSEAENCHEDYRQPKDLLSHTSYLSCVEETAQSRETTVVGSYRWKVKSSHINSAKHLGECCLTPCSERGSLTAIDVPLPK